MFSLFRSRLLCAAEAAVGVENTARLNLGEFTGRVGTATNPRMVAPVITSHVLNGNREISFTCISRIAAAKAIHASAIANSKNETKFGAFVRPEIAKEIVADKGELGKGLTAFRVTVFPRERPVNSDDRSRFSRRTRVSANVDQEELARNIHASYLRKTPLVLECMGDKAMGIITQAMALFNERVQVHDMVAYVRVVSGKSSEGTELIKMEFQLMEVNKKAH